MIDCILVKATASNGYGWTWDRLNKRNRYAHRVAWEVVHGGIPSGLWVLHKCDVRNCINVDHLYLGDRKQNMKDCVDRGRHNHAKKTHCKRGHKFNAQNTRIAGGARHCRLCRNDLNAGYRAGRKVSK